MTDLRTAAQALVDRWDTPLWKDAEHTGKYIDALRQALAASPAMTEAEERAAFEAWAASILDGNPTWRGSGDCELAWQSWMTRAALSAPVGWQPIETAPENMTEPVVVRWVNSDGEEERQFDYKEDGCWVGWHEHAEYTLVIGGWGVSETPPYAHYMPLAAAPSPQEQTCR